MHIVIACGASGGHIFPGVALAQELKKEISNEVVIVSSDREIDKAILGRCGCRFTMLPQNPFVRTYNPFIQARFIVRLAGNIFAMLGDIGGLGRDTRIVGNIILPSVRFNSLRIIGK